MVNKKFFIAVWLFSIAGTIFFSAETAEAKKIAINAIGIKFTLPKTWANAKWSFTQRKNIEGCLSSPPWNGVWIKVKGEGLDLQRSFIIYEVPKEFTACSDIDEEWKMMKKKRIKYRYYWIDRPETDSTVRKEKEKIAKSARFIRRRPPSAILDAS